MKRWKVGASRALVVLALLIGAQVEVLRAANPDEANGPYLWTRVGAGGARTEEMNALRFDPLTRGSRADGKRRVK